MHGAFEVIGIVKFPKKNVARSDRDPGQNIPTPSHKGFFETDSKWSPTKTKGYPKSETVSLRKNEKKLQRRSPRLDY